MRSLTVKLTLAFLLVGLIGASLVALLVAQRTRSEFDRLLSERDQNVLVEALGKYYDEHGNWTGVRDMLQSTQPLAFYSREVALLDANGTVVLGNRGYDVGQNVPASARSSGVAVEADNQTVGYVVRIDTRPPNGSGGRTLPPPDVDFLRRVTWASALSAGIAALIALILGLLLARTLTQPLREL
ncbi:MAG TPA: two-component sensor histidine kinase, partial [Roseiflexaceae bacterium]|nr:two-component sensor histidine kinase [Roseiflexaceae bacterium]